MSMMRSLARSLGPDSFDEVGVVRAALSRATGTFVDVGALAGTSLLPFAHDGWQVWAFEPDEMSRARLRRQLAELPNVHVDERPVGRTDGAYPPVPPSTDKILAGVSVLTPVRLARRPTSTVETVRLDTFAEEHSIKDVTVLKTDAAGHDLPVLETFPWHEIRPRAVVCGFDDRKTEPLGYLFDDLGTFLTTLGYEVFVSEWHPVAEHGTMPRWRGMRPYPSELSDSRAWGKFIAVDPFLASRVRAHAKRSGRRLRLRLAAEHIPPIARWL